MFVYLAGSLELEVTRNYLETDSQKLAYKQACSVHDLWMPREPWYVKGSCQRANFSKDKHKSGMSLLISKEMQ